MLLDTLGASLLGNLLTGKGVICAGEGVIHAGEGVSKKSNLLMLPHPLTNFEIDNCYVNDPKFNSVFSRDNLPDVIKNGGYVINLDEHDDIGKHWVAFIR